MANRARAIAGALILVAGVMHAGSVAAECRHFSTSELRRMAIKEVIKIGVTADHVERAWGKPSKKRSESTGDVWEYWNPTGDQLVEFGLDGCVKGWRTQRD